MNWRWPNAWRSIRPSAGRGIYPLTAADPEIYRLSTAPTGSYISARSDLADVAVLRSYASIAYNQPRCQLSAVLAEQALIEAAVPFHLIFDKHLENLAPYRVLVLPDTECLVGRADRTDPDVRGERRRVDGGRGVRNVRRVAKSTPISRTGRTW